MTTKDWISIFSLIISGIAILISYHSNVKQSELQERIKNKELEFSRKKIWYEKQADVIDELLMRIEKIGTHATHMTIERYQNLTGEARKEFIAQTNTNNEDFSNWVNVKKYYFSKTIYSNLDKMHSNYINMSSDFEKFHNEKMEDYRDEILKNYSQIINEIQKKFLE